MAKLTEAGRDAKKVQKALDFVREVRNHYDLRAPIWRLLNDAAGNLQTASQVLSTVAWFKEELDG